MIHLMNLHQKNFKHAEEEETIKDKGIYLRSVFTYSFIFMLRDSSEIGSKSPAETILFH